MATWTECAPAHQSVKPCKLAQAYLCPAQHLECDSHTPHPTPPHSHSTPSSVPLRELLKLDTHNKIFFGKAGLTLVLRGSLGVKLYAKGGDAAALQRQ